MWYRLANQFGTPTPFVPEPSRPLGSNEAEHIAEEDTTEVDSHHLPEKPKEKPNPYTQNLEGQLADLHHETQYQIDFNAFQPDQLWRGDNVKHQSDAEIPQGKNWPSSVGRTHV